MLVIQIIQRHKDGVEDFNRTWEEYEEGFGDINHGYWIGKNWALSQENLSSGDSDKVSFKPVSSATETSLKLEISLAESVDMVLCNKRITMALIRLRRCAGWSAPLLFATPPPEDRFSRDEAQLFFRRYPAIGKIRHVCSAKIQINLCSRLKLLSEESLTLGDRRTCTFS